MRTPLLLLGLLAVSAAALGAIAPAGAVQPAAGENGLTPHATGNHPAPAGARNEAAANRGEVQNGDKQQAGNGNGNGSGDDSKKENKAPPRESSLAKLSKTAAGVTSSCNVQNGKDVTGGKLSPAGDTDPNPAVVASADACCALCGARGDTCVVWTFHDSDRKCFMYSYATGTAAAASGIAYGSRTASTGDVPPPPAVTPSGGKTNSAEPKGSVLMSTSQSAGADECKADCGATQGCAGWTYDENLRTCKLWSKALGTPQARAHSVFGFRTEAVGGGGGGGTKAKANGDPLPDTQRETAAATAAAATHGPPPAKTGSPTTQSARGTQHA